MKSQNKFARCAKDKKDQKNTYLVLDFVEEKHFYLLIVLVSDRINKVTCAR